MSDVVGEGGGGWVDEIPLVVVIEFDEWICLAHMVGCSAWLEGLGCSAAVAVLSWSMCYPERDNSYNDVGNWKASHGIWINFMPLSWTKWLTQSL